MLKKKEETYNAEKKLLEQVIIQQKEELQSVIGGAGDKPITEQVKELCGIVKADAGTLEDAVASLKENLNGIPGPTVLSQVEVLKETLVTVQEEKENLAKIHLKIKRATGGSGGSTPILSRIQRISENNAKLTKEKRTAEEEIIYLKEALATSQREKECLRRRSIEAETQLAAVRNEVGGGGDTPLPERLQKFRKALEAEVVIARQEVEDARSTASVLAGESSMLEEELLPKERLVENMMNIIAAKDEALTELFIKYKRAKQEAKALDQELSITQVAHSERKEILQNMQRVIIDKDEANNDLHIELLRTRANEKSLDEELSVEQVVHAEERATYNYVLGIQTNTSPLIHPDALTKTSEINQTT